MPPCRGWVLAFAIGPVHRSPEGNALPASHHLMRVAARPQAAGGIARDHDDDARGTKTTPPKGEMRAIS